MTGLKMFMRLIGAFFGFLLGMVVWLAPHIDWSNAKDDSFLGTRGLVVLGMTAWVFGTLVFSALDLEPKLEVKKEPETNPCDGGCC